jgi:anion-transporting  ArsA/GET3 family ATPase
MSKKKRSEVYICIGAGGVGKTTVASILGIHFALQGHHTLVITVDPARRLLDALAIDKHEPEPQQVNITHFSKSLVKNGGQLFAFMPDLKREWRDFLKASIGHADVLHDITSNHFYRYMEEGLPGAFEIICSHVLFRLREKEQFDTIILDTPPSSHSVLFFDVPKKISKVLEQGIFRRLMSRRHSVLLKLTKKIAFFSGGVLEKTLERIIGSHFLSELIDFTLTIDELYEPMLKRVKAMEKLFKDSDTKYVLVVRPSPASIMDCFNLKDSLKKRGIIISQVVMNQVIPKPKEEILLNEINSLREKLITKEEINAIEQLIFSYLDEIKLENSLIEKVSQEFLSVDKRLLFLQDISLNRTTLLTKLLTNYLDEAF